MQKPPLIVSITMIIALALTTAVAAIAADPIIGTWKLNVAKSKFSQSFQAATKQVPRKERTEVYREMEGDQIEMTGKEIRTDGSSGSTKWTWPRQGGIAKRQSPAPLPVEEGGVETLIAPGDWYATWLQNGKQVAVIHKTFSKDGKIMHQTTTGADAQGRPFEHIEVYDKQ